MNKYIVEYQQEKSDGLLYTCYSRVIVEEAPALAMGEFIAYDFDESMHHLKIYKLEDAM